MRHAADPRWRERHQQTLAPCYWHSRRPLCGDSGEILFPEFPRVPALAARAAMLRVAQVHTTDLAGHGFGHCRELQPPDTLVRRQSLAAMLEDRLRGAR